MTDEARGDRRHARHLPRVDVLAEESDASVRISPRTLIPSA
jgi:hypothetical protein